MRSLSLLLLGLLIPLPTWAQTIDQADIRSQVDVEIAAFVWTDESGNPGSAMPDTTGLDAILNGAEADFTSMAAGLNQLSTSRLLEMPADVPGADSFVTATHVQALAILGIGGEQDSTAHLFIDLQQDAMTYLGASSAIADTDQDGVIDTLATRYVPDGWELRNFPLSVGHTWETVFDQQTWIPTSAAGLVRSPGTHEERTYEVLGTTTLTTPAGTAPAIVLHLFEEVRLGGGLLFAREQFSFIAEGGLAVEVAFEIDPDTQQRLSLNDIAYFEPQGDSGTDVDAAGDVVPAAFRLDPNYPNPFNPTTTIPFSLTQRGHTQLTVYDSLGRAVTVLVDAPLAAGSYTAMFDAGDLPSGAYLYRLQVDGMVVQSHIMLLAK